MTTRAVWLAVALLGLVAPVLVFPGALGFADMRVAAAVGMVSLVVATGLAQSHGRLAWAVALLAVSSVIGWSRAADNVNTLNHFCGLALGLLTMGTVAAWSRTRTALALVTGAVLIMGAVTLAVGIRSITPIHGTKAQATNPLAAPGKPVPLPLRELHARTSVNPNALGATAMLILPVAAAVALAPAVWFSLPLTLRLVGWLTAGWAAVVVLLTQSRSVWLSALCVVLLVTRRWIRPGMWWRLMGLGGILLAAFVYVAGDHPRVRDLAAGVSGRAEIWRDGLQALQSAPWFGIGLDYLRDSGLAMVRIAPDRVVGVPHAHNIFLQTALDVGLFGLAGYLAIIGFVLRRSFELVGSGGVDRWVRAVGVGAGLSVVSVHVYGVFDAVPLGAKVGIFQWLSCGLILAAWRMRTPPEET